MLTMRGAATLTAMQIFMLHIMWVSASESVDLNECHTFVTDGHLRSLDEMINSQVESSCVTEVQLLQKGSLSDYCYTRGLVYQLYNLMNQHMKFKNNQVFHNNTNALKKMYEMYIEKCVLNDHDGKLMENPTICKSDKEYLTTIQILEKVKKLFIDAKYFRLNYTDHPDCEELYERECEKNETNAESKTEESRKIEKHKIIVTAILGMMGILCLGGLLYGLLYKRKYQMLRRHLNRERHDPEIPEERPLNNPQIELELL
uniref:Macrophage colony-stimulating factor 1 n=1 Tax=Leptobrachium leishanense TaxID=445787 RepID=A0A8C5M0T9_9ANUR